MRIKQKYAGTPGIRYPVASTPTNVWDWQKRTVRFKLMGWMAPLTAS